MEIGFGEEPKLIATLSPSGATGDRIEVRETPMATSVELELCWVREGTEGRSIFLSAANEDELYEVLRKRREAR